MTFIGKCFSVAIFILSCGFMFLALAVNASHRNWRDVVLGAGGFKSQIEAFTIENEQLVDARERIEAKLVREQAARRTALGNLQSQRDQLAEQLANSLSSNQQLEAENTELTQLDLSRAKLLEEITGANKVLRTQIREEQEDRDKLFAQTLVLTDNMNELRGVRQELERRNQALLKQITRYKEVVDAVDVDINEPLHGAPPRRNGYILVIDRPRLLVEVSIGHDDGLRSGHLLEVTRGGRYVGKLKVVRVEPNRSVAEIQRDYSEGILKEGDRVDTTIE